MRKINLIAAIAGLTCLASTTASAQYYRWPAVPDVTFELGGGVVRSTKSHLSPMGEKHHALFDKTIAPAAHAQLLFRTSPHGAVGFEAEGLTFAKTYEGMDLKGTVRQGFAGLAFMQSSSTRSKVFTRLTWALGYVHTEHRIKDNKLGKTEKIWAPGVGASIRFTIATHIGRNASLGLQFGISSYNSLKWHGSDKFIDNEGYSNKVFGEKVNLNLYPSVGIVLTNALSSWR